MQTIGVAGGVKPLRILLARLRGRLNPGGSVLADSSELREVWDGDASDRSAERGEIVLATRYGRLRGEPFPWVYLAEADLAAVAQAAGYTVETLMRVESGEYLVELRAATGAASDAVPGDGTGGDAVSRRGGVAAR
ncbi:MAG: hypothetical protein IPK00_14625 [Deltaproteobacteria bacterium]|nr:hypothetical protein [Deltaproteobacteria bacterium]